MTIPTVDPAVELKHVLKHVLALQPDSTLEMAVKKNGLMSIDEVLANDDAAIATLMYIDGFVKVEDRSKSKPTTPQTLLSGVVTQAGTLHQMWIHQTGQLDPILDWTMIMQTDYVTFMRTILPMYGGTISASVPPPLSKTKSLTSTVTTSNRIL